MKVLRFIILIPFLSMVFLTLRCTVDDDKFVGPSDDPDRYVLFKSFTSSKDQLTTNGDTCSVKLEIMNPQKDPIPGILVTFTAELGEITAVDTTNEDGIARVLYTTLEEDGIEKIIVNTGTKEDSLFFTIIKGSISIQLSVHSDSTEIHADGVSGVNIQALAQNEDGDPVTDIKIYLFSSSGSIPSYGYADVNGTVTARLISSVSSEDITAIVYGSLISTDSLASKSIQSLKEKALAKQFIQNKSSSRSTMRRPRKLTEPSELKAVLSTISNTESPVPEQNTKALTQGDSLEIVFLGLTVNISTEDTEILANNNDSTIVIIKVLETSKLYNRVPDVEVEVIPTLGYVRESAVTGSNGVGTVTLYSENEAGVSTITGLIGNTVSANTTVNFLSAYPTQTTISSSESVLLANGLESTVIKCSVKDTLGNPTEGVDIVFSATNGTLNQTNLTTNASGDAEVILTGTVSNQDYSVVVLASLPQFPDLKDSVEIEFMGVTLTAYSNESSLTANGINSTSIIAVLFQSSSHNAVNNREVSFSTNLGTIISPVLTNSSGLATTTLTSGIFAGQARVVAEFGDGITDTVFVDFLSSGAKRMTLDVEDDVILANGISTTSVNVIVVDTLDNPVPYSPVEFSSDQGIFSDLIVQTDLNGVASTELTSIASQSDQYVWVRANIITNAYNQDFQDLIDRSQKQRINKRVNTQPIQQRSSGSLRDSLLVTFRGITINSAALNNTLVANGLSSTTIQTTVLETSTNNPIPNANLLYSTNLGLIDGNQTTGQNGVATTTLVSGYGSGIANVIVRYGNLLTDTVSVNFLPGGPNNLDLISSSNSVLADGLSEVNLFATVTDTLGSPISEVIVQFVSNFGSVLNESAITDETGVATTTLISEASISDLLSTITVSVEGIQTTDDIQINLIGVTIEGSTNDDYLTANGIANTIIGATLFESSTYNPIQNVPVNFSTSHGSITPLSVTNTLGLATATLTAGIGAATANVYLQYGNAIRDTVLVEFLSSAANEVTITSSSTELIANGLSSTDVSATVMDTLGNPVEGVSVIFETSYGTLSNATVETNSNGISSTQLTSAASNQNLPVVISATVTNLPSVTNSIIITYRGVTIEGESEVSILPADGNSSTIISATVYETSSHAALQNEDVHFSSSLGIITSMSTTNSIGIATAELVTNTVAGSAEVVVSTGATLSDTLIIQFASHDPGSTYISSDQQSILADGITTSSITTTILDTLGNAVSGTQVSFETSNGSIAPATATTDASGIASATLTSTASVTDLTASVKATVTGYPLVTDSIDVTFRGITVNVIADPISMLADGSSTSTITVGIVETSSGNPVTHSFDLSTTLGSIPSVSTTDQSGLKTVVFTAGLTPGTATITADAGVAGSTNVTLLPPNPTDLEISAGSTSILADGTATTSVTATVIDTLGNPVEGVSVIFETSYGTLSNATVETNSNGISSTQLTSAASNQNLPVVISATVTNLPSVTNSIIITYRGVTIEGESEVSILPADGNSSTTITANAYETSSHAALQNEDVHFSSSLGLITSMSTTNSFGIATAELVTSNVAGSAEVVVSTGATLSDTLIVQFASHDPDSISISSDQQSILADGITTSSITTTILDTLGNAASGTQVSFETSNGSIAPATATTDASGIASATLTSTASVTDLTTSVKATVPDYPLVTDSVDVTFRGITLTVAALDTWLIADGSSSAQIIAQLQERTSGNPLNNRTIFWSTTLGTIPYSSTTNNIGQATTILTSGTEAGMVIVTASFGNILTSSDSIVFSSPSDSTLVMSWVNPSGNNGDGTDNITISVLLVDEFSNPVESSVINFSLTPNTYGTIISPKTTDGNGLATTTLTYSSQFVGESLRIWSSSSSTIGYMDITLPPIN